MSSFGLLAAVDLPLFDAGTIGCAVMFPATRLVHSMWGGRPRPNSLILLFDLLRGAALFPFVLLICGAFSRELLQTIMEANRTTVFLGGLIGGFSVFNADRWVMEYLRADMHGVD